MGFRFPRSFARGAFEVRMADADNEFAVKEGWTKRVVLLGNLSPTGGAADLRTREIGESSCQ